jgi:hypothetical protein
MGFGIYRCSRWNGRIELHWNNCLWSLGMSKYRPNLFSVWLLTWPPGVENQKHKKCYIKSCSQEVAKHKSGVNPSDGTTFSHNIKEDGNAIRTNGDKSVLILYQVFHPCYCVKTNFCLPHNTRSRSFN